MDALILQKVWQVLWKVSFNFKEDKCDRGIQPLFQLVTLKLSSTLFSFQQIWRIRQNDVMFSAVQTEGLNILQVTISGTTFIPNSIVITIGSKVQGAIDKQDVLCTW
jgi:hypothetical protein